MNRKPIRRKPDKRHKFDPQKYKGIQMGPFVLEQYGRYFGFGSLLTPEEHEEHRRSIKAKQPEFKLEIDAKIAELIKIATDSNPLELVAAIAPENIFGNPETIKESTFKGRECYVEYAVSLALAVDTPNFDIHATKEQIDRFRALIAEIFNDTFWYFAVGSLDDEESGRRIRFKSLAHYLMVRGDSYPQHHIDLIKDVFEPHNDFFRKNYGFVIADILLFLEGLEKQGMDSLQRFGAFSTRLHQSHDAFIKFVENEVDEPASMEELIEKFDQMPGVEANKEALIRAYQNVDENIFEVKPTNCVPEHLLRLTSANFGANREFITFEKSPGWVTNNSIISRRPVINHERKYYCFGIQLLYRNIISILESLIKENDKRYFETTFQRLRGDGLAAKSLEYIGDLLPGAKIHPNLYYSDNGERFETDGIVIFDSFLFIVEAKSGTLSLPAKRGSLERIKRNVGDLVDEAYVQAIRTKRFICDHEKPKFENEDGSEALTIHNKELYRNIILISVTLDNLGHLVTDLPSLKKFQLLQGEEWIWSIFINDLRIISEIVEIPTEFLVYLQRRLNANEYPQFEVKDELDFFLYYLKEGLYFEEGWINKYQKFGLFPFTEQLDRYYSYKAGRVSSGVKPRLEIPDGYKELIKRIEESGKEGFADVTTVLLGFSVDSMEEILKQIEIAKQLSNSNERDHDFTMIFGDSDLGLTVSIIAKEGGRSLVKDRKYCELKMYQTKIARWIWLSIDIRDNAQLYDFECLERPWKYDLNREHELEIFTLTRLQNYFQIHKKPNPNEPCPCNSGKKFKKCCNSRMLQAGGN